MIYDVYGTDEEQERALWARDVLLDGVKVERAIYADTEAGIVRFYRVDEAGDYVVDEATRDVIIDEKRGKVEVIEERQR